MDFFFIFKTRKALTQRKRSKREVFLLQIFSSIFFLSNFFFFNFFSSLLSLLPLANTQKYSEFYAQKNFTRQFFGWKRLFRSENSAKLIDFDAQITSLSLNLTLKFQIFSTITRKKSLQNAFFRTLAKRMNQRLRALVLY